MTDTQCPKVHSYITKRFSEDEARQAVKHHLTHSSYHEMEEGDAQIMAEAADLQSEEEEVWQQEEPQQVHCKGAGKGKAKLVQAPSTPPDALARASSPAPDITKAIEQAIVNVQQRGHKRDFEIESRRVMIPTLPASQISMSREMATTIADTLGRAEQTAAQGAAIAESAAAAFRQEADNLRRLKAYIDNKLR